MSFLPLHAPESDHRPGPRLTSPRPGPAWWALPAPQASGSAVAYAAGEHTGAADQVFSGGERLHPRRQRGGPGHLSLAALKHGGLGGQRPGHLGGADGDGRRRDHKMGLRSRGTISPWATPGPSWPPAPSGAASLLDRDRDTAWGGHGLRRRADHHGPGPGRPGPGPCPGRPQPHLRGHGHPHGQHSRLLGHPGVVPGPWRGPRPHLVCFMDQTYRHWRLRLQDPDNPAGALTAGLLYLGPYFQPSRTFKQRPPALHGGRPRSHRHGRGQAGRRGPGHGRDLRA